MLRRVQPRVRYSHPNGSQSHNLQSQMLPNLPPRSRSCTWHALHGGQKNSINGEYTLYGFLTTEPKAIVQPARKRRRSMTRRILASHSGCRPVWRHHDLHGAVRLRQLERLLSALERHAMTDDALERQPPEIGGHQPH
jgi:hypothetical protein